MKMENVQPSGSFKLRGIGAMCQRAVARGARHIVCPSGGNAGAAAAVAGTVLGVTTTIVVPTTTHASVCEKLRMYGAEVRVHGSVWDEANEEALRLCHAEGAVYVPPFDHPDIWDGNATLIDEALAQGGRFDAVICSVGGGGLMCGVLEGLHRNGLRDVPVLAVETHGAASLSAAMQAGQPVTLAAITSVATSLGARRVARTAFDWTARHDVRSVIVSDRQAIDACRKFADDMRALVEPACGAALAVAYDAMPELDGFERPLIVICGGLSVDLAKLESWQK